MRDLDRAVDRLAAAVLEGEPVHVFGDFDADGVCGTAVLVEALGAAGARVTASIPHRVHDGHGIGRDAVLEAASRGVRVGLSVDTGTTCFAACEAARDAGLDLIVTDHHLPDGDALPPAFAVLNPARADCGFAERRLCGTGVAFFLLIGLWRRLREAGREPEYDLRRLLDRVALATVADVMDLVGVNRILVRHGLARINEAPSPGLAALLQVAGRKSPADAATLAFQLAPRINAAGRMDHGDDALRLLLANDPDEALELARRLDGWNRERRRIEAAVHREAERMLEGARVLAAWHPEWHAGVVGLAAGHLARRHGKPAAIGFAEGRGRIRVSLRGRPGYHVRGLLERCAKHLESFGGHAGAGGGVVREENWEAFVDAFGAAIEEQSAEADAPRLEVDGYLELGALHPSLAARLERFEPTGQGNPPVRFLLEPAGIHQARELGRGVLRLRLGMGGRLVDAVAFQAGRFNGALTRGRRIAAIGRLERDGWRGGEAIQFVIEDALDMEAR